MTKGEIIPFRRGDDADRFHHADGELSASSPSAASGGLENFQSLGDAALPVILRLQGKLPRLRVRSQAGDKPATSQT